MAEHGEHGGHDFQNKYVALVAGSISMVILILGLVGIYISTF